MPVRGEDNIDEAIKALKEGTNDALKETVKQGDEKIDEGFNKGKDAMGRPWKQLAPETVRRKGHDDILIDSGDMREDIRWSFDRNRREARLGGDDKKLPIHEFGTEHVPKRPVLEPAAQYMANEVLEETFTRELAEQFLTVDIRRILR